MNIKTISGIIVIVTALLLAQTVAVVDAHHNTDPRNKTARKIAEEKDKNLDNQGNDRDVIKEKRDAFLAYKTAFAAWKMAKEAYKSAKTAGDKTIIDSKKIILDASKITKDDALKDYKQALKMRAK